MRERLSSGRGDAEGTAVAGARIAGAHEAARLERLQLAIHVARRDVPESSQPAPRFFEKIPAGRRSLVQEPEQGGLRRVQQADLGIADSGIADFEVAVHLTFPSGGLASL